MDGWIQDLWLVAIVDDVPDDAVSRWWNLKEATPLDDLLDAAPGVRLGTILTTSAEPEPGSPTRRVFDLMYLRGTLPEEFDHNARASYVLPLLDAGLRSALLAAFAPQPDDHRLAEAAPVSELAEFLDSHEGARLAPHPRTEAVRALPGAREPSG
ncbi:hypothetical protein V6V47_07405 [Micromonospora sp. CPCC 205539]|uniref:hypothetical protein n=1 Tax=Micromonospora sp. CPCC 205539 TaxID=3122408 RepID=UPI002FF1370D